MLLVSIENRTLLGQDQICLRSSEHQSFLTPCRTCCTDQTDNNYIHQGVESLSIHTTGSCFPVNKGNFINNLVPRTLYSLKMAAPKRRLFYLIKMATS